MNAVKENAATSNWSLCECSHLKKVCMRMQPRQIGLCECSHVKMRKQPLQNGLTRIQPRQNANAATSKWPYANVAKSKWSMRMQPRQNANATTSKWPYANSATSKCERNLFKIALCEFSHVKTQMQPRQNANAPTLNGLMRMQPRQVGLCECSCGYSRNAYNPDKCLH